MCILTVNLLVFRITAHRCRGRHQHHRRHCCRCYVLIPQWHAMPCIKSTCTHYILLINTVQEEKLNQPKQRCWCLARSLNSEPSSFCVYVYRCLCVCSSFHFFSSVYNFNIYVKNIATCCEIDSINILLYPFSHILSEGMREQAKNPDKILFVWVFCSCCFSRHVSFVCCVGSRNAIENCYKKI